MCYMDMCGQREKLQYLRLRYQVWDRKRGEREVLTRHCLEMC